MAKAEDSKEKNEVIENAKSDVQEFYDKKGEETQENLLKGGKPVVINLLNKTMIEFTEDYGFFKKGHRQEVSDVALSIYLGKGVIKKL